jgi:hypothetical protein
MKEVPIENEGPDIRIVVFWDVTSYSLIGV